MENVNVHVPGIMFIQCENSFKKGKVFYSLWKYNIKLVFKVLVHVYIGVFVMIICTCRFWTIIAIWFTMCTWTVSIPDLTDQSLGPSQHRRNDSYGPQSAVSGTRVRRRPHRPVQFPSVSSQGWNVSTPLSGTSEIQKRQTVKLFAMIPSLIIIIRFWWGR